MRLVLFADPETGEASYHQVLLHGGGDLADDVRHLLLAGLVLDVGLLEEHAALSGEDRGHLALDDLLPDVLGLASYLVGGRDDLALALEEVLGHILARYPARLHGR